MDPEEKVEAFAAILYAEPGTLGLIANIMSALIVAVENMLNGPFSQPAMTLAGAHLIVMGGFLQLVAALLCFRRNDHLTGTAFAVFAALWTVMGINHILAPVMGAEILRVGILPGMIGFMTVAVILSLCAITVNYIMPPVLFAIMLTLIFEGVGAFFDWGRRVAAAFELFIVITSVYASVVMALKGVSQRYILPGLGNAIFDPLLIRVKENPNTTNEARKNTKYGEPYGLGYMGNVVPAATLVFHHLGYFADFRAAMPMFVYCFYCHLLASYYAFLRHDFFHAVEFSIYFLFWLSRGAIQLLISLNFPGIDDVRVNFFGQWGLIAIALFLLLLSAVRSKVVFMYNFLFLCVVVLSVDHIPHPAHNFSFGVSGAIFAIISLYVSMAHLENSIAEKSVMWIGEEVIHTDKLKKALIGIFKGMGGGKGDNSCYRDEDKVDLKIVDTVALIANSVALACLAPLEAQRGGTLALPWIVVSGLLLNLYAVRLSFTSGSLAKAYYVLVLAGFWAVWSALLIDNTLAFNLRSASVGILVLHTIGMFVTPVFTRVWVPFSIFMELCTIALVVRCFNTNPAWMILITAILACTVCLYGAIAELVNGVLMDVVIPVGFPVFEEKYIDPYENPPCPLFPSRRSSALRKVAKVLDNAGVIGTPTDTVYAIAASCKHPGSIQRIYTVKERPPEKPICLCLANLEQLKEASPDFSPLLWNFMERCYPGGISCVVPKGQWMYNLGIGDAYDLVGTKDSICIRVPDSCVLAYLVSWSGPIALTSGNPSGGADSTHHSMLIGSLGQKLDAVICDGESRELVASTVVNCMNIDQGEISYFRIGCTPKEIVDQHFEDAKAAMAEKNTVVTLGSADLKK
ncbi:uncharacterized protein [Haliotis asinina]|uniref:uncharacterized protein n=1 Tax=Haliotis asinina TaxID=109174 RepID=UPI0035328070